MQGAPCSSYLASTLDRPTVQIKIVDRFSEIQVEHVPTCGDAACRHVRTNAAELPQQRASTAGIVVAPAYCQSQTSRHTSRAADPAALVSPRVLRLQHPLWAKPKRHGLGRFHVRYGACQRQLKTRDPRLCCHYHLATVAVCLARTLNVANLADFIATGGKPA